MFHIYALEALSLGLKILSGDRFTERNQIYVAVDQIELIHESLTKHICEDQITAK